MSSQKPLWRDELEAKPLGSFWVGAWAKAKSGLGVWLLALTGAALGLMFNLFMAGHNGYGLIIQFPPLINYLTAAFLGAGFLMFLAGAYYQLKSRR